MTRLAALAGRIDAWGPQATGSTRAVALMRIGLGCIALVRFGDELAPYLMATLPGLVLGLAFFFFAACTILGIRARSSAAALGGTILTLYLLARHGMAMPGWSHHHVYLLAVALILLSLTDCGRSLSVDRMRALAAAGGAAPPPERGALLGQKLIALQLAALYFWTAVDKTDWAFISGQRLEQTFTWVYSGRALEVLLQMPWLLAAASIIVLVVEYWLAVAILMPKWRRAAILVGLSLHATFYLMLPVNTYSVTVIVLYLALLDPAAVHRFIDRMLGQTEPAR